MFPPNNFHTQKCYTLPPQKTFAHKSVTPCFPRHFRTQKCDILPPPQLLHTNVWYITCPKTFAHKSVKRGQWPPMVGMGSLIFPESWQTVCLAQVGAHFGTTQTQTQTRAQTAAPSWAQIVFILMQIVPFWAQMGLFGHKHGHEHKHGRKQISPFQIFTLSNCVKIFHPFKFSPFQIVWKLHFAFWLKLSKSYACHCRKITKSCSHQWWEANFKLWFAFICVKHARRSAACL